MLRTDFSPRDSLMMESRYFPAYVASGVRLNVLVGCFCTVTAACTKDQLPGTKNYLGTLSFI